ncbi:MAG: hypothetical protein GY891_08575 [Bacteroidetes bacterium]|nr:hypothetical protein [Bacteroidota bacterium]
MAVAQDQQKLTAEFIELQQKELDALRKERKETALAHARALKNIESDLSHRFHMGWIMTSIVICLTVAAIICGSSLLYVQYITRGLASSEAAYDKMKGYNAELSTCEYKKKSYPCIRVMASWGGYGDDEDYFIIDPK